MDQTEQSDIKYFVTSVYSCSHMPQIMKKGTVAFMLREMHLKSLSDGGGSEVSRNLYHTARLELYSAVTLRQLYMALYSGH